MKRPAQRGAGTGDGGQLVPNILPDAGPCPLACIAYHRHGELCDRTGRVRATVCGLCGQLVTRESWAQALAGCP